MPEILSQPGQNAPKKYRKIPPGCSCAARPTMCTGYNSAMSMHVADFVLSAPWIVPMTVPDLVLREHAVVVRGGRIVELVPRAQSLAKYPHLPRIERPDHIILPGLVNAHTHAGMSFFRGFAEGLPLMKWLGERIWPLERRFVTAQFVYDAALLSIAEMLKSGVTCFADMYFFPAETARAAIEQGLRAQIGMPIAEFESPWARNADEYLSKALAVRDEFRNHAMIRTAFAPHAPYTVSDATFRRLRTLADELDSCITIHLHESAAEVQESLAQHGKRPIERLAQLGLLTPALNAVHMVHIERSDIECALRNGISVTLCPESNLKLGNGPPPIAQWVASGVPLAIGTDGPASNNDQDLWSEIKLAALLSRPGSMGGASSPMSDPPQLTGEAAPTLSPWQALALMTRGAARAIGFEDLVGTLEPGKSADLCCVDLNMPATQPVYDPLAQLVYSSARDQVSDVWAAGRHLLADREFTHLDWPQVAAGARRWAQTLGEQRDAS
jgi:5-methylthioadenosine/S-adenosylhomocysteine deaminase